MAKKVTGLHEEVDRLLARPKWVGGLKGRYGGVEKPRTVILSTSEESLNLPVSLPLNNNAILHFVQDDTFSTPPLSPLSQIVKGSLTPFTSFKLECQL
ncbi:MAG: hypothetical protein NTZ51_11915 [Proteobacteria bacterium]|nr:hypothetical protein [Pseudomonadota bacterium]